MTDKEKMSLLRTFIGEASVPDAVLFTLLQFAGRRVINHVYPFRDDIAEVPARYEHAQIRATVELYAKMGAEGEVSHSENGISRVWESADISKSVLSELTPYVGGVN